MKAIKKYYLANWFYRHHFRFIPFLLKGSIYLSNKSFIDPSTKIGKNCVLGYRGIAVVIHKRAIIGNNVTIGTCVIIGGNKKEQGVPVIEDNCYIATGAKILGNITIGTGSFIGANSVVTRSVPPKSLVSGIPGKVIKENINIDEYR